jgi:hypothetical protein
LIQSPSALFLFVNSRQIGTALELNYTLHYSQEKCGGSSILAMTRSVPPHWPARSASAAVNHSFTETLWQAHIEISKQKCPAIRVLLNSGSLAAISKLGSDLRCRYPDYAV